MRREKEKEKKEQMLVEQLKPLEGDKHSIKQCFRKGLRFFPHSHAGDVLLIDPVH